MSKIEWKDRVIEYDPDKQYSDYDPTTKLLIEDAREYIKSLPPRQARIGSMYFIDGNTQVEISEVEDTTINAIDLAVRRIGKKLRERYA